MTAIIVTHTADIRPLVLRAVVAWGVIRFVVVVVAAVLASACYSPGYRDCEVTCAGGTCPSGLRCDQGVCRLPGMNGACGTVDGDGPGSDALEDGRPDGSPATGWMTPMQVVPVSGQPRTGPTLNGAMTELYFARNGELWRMTRATGSGAFGGEALVPGVNDSALSETAPDVNPAGTVMYFGRMPNNRFRIVRSQRPTGTVLWDYGTLVGGLGTNQSGEDVNAPSIAVGEQVLVYENLIDLQQPVWGANWDPNTLTWLPSGPLGLGPDAHSPSVSANGTVYFHRSNQGQADLFVSTYDPGTNLFAPPQAISTVNTGAHERDPWISQDGMHLYFTREDGNGVQQLWFTQQMQ